MAHGADEFAVAEGVVALVELNRADFYFGPFSHLEDQDNGIAGGNAFVFGRHRGELVAMLGKQLLERHFRFFNFRGIEKLALDASSRLSFSLKRSRMSDSEIEWMPRRNECASDHRAVRSPRK